ncbi:hypothetical protein B0T21DRAFT_444793 [Apiosordaria backusii]|uniref:Extracellular serine-rich protein n=1 Tax=Apiosordaria backusii TaxID=314023 RepID=A0AA40B7J0_9PEZI|nr:hypothetical protein B0T21DRAFT_444793 [Apiosordaria backusii]
MILSYSFGLLAALSTTTMAQITYLSTTTAPTPTTSGSSSSSSAPATRTIAVGLEGHAFTPKETTANVGDIIKFNFYPGGHRVARAEFGFPCIPYEYVNGNTEGFWTGVFNPQAILNPPPSYEVRVNDTKPIFFYCAAPHSCTDWQMIGVINPNSTATFDAQLALAKQAKFQLEPGEPFPTESARGGGPTSTSTSTPNSSTDPDNNDDSSSGSGGGGLAPGAIAGIAIGAAAVVILAAVLLYLCGRRGGFDKAYRKSFGNPAVPGVAGGVGGGRQNSMVEANYGNNPKSPGSSTIPGFGNDGYNNFGQGSPVAAGGYQEMGGSAPNSAHPGYGGLQQQHTGYSEGGNGSPYHSPHTSPQPGFQPNFGHAPPPPPPPVPVQAPVELPGGDATGPGLTGSPPPQYPSGERGSWWRK